MGPVRSTPRLTVVGNPDNRRVHLFLAAAAAAGLPPPHVLPWRRVVGGGPVVVEPGSLVRVDSPGEDTEVERALRKAERAAEPGEIVGRTAWYDGFASALRRVAAAAVAAGAELLADPEDLLVLFDKRACHARLAHSGVPVPPGLARPPAGYEDLRAALARHGWSRVFVKPVHGSSASGVLALQVSHGRVAGPRVRATTSVELVHEGGRVRLYNSLRVRHYRDERDVAAIVDTLAPDGLHVERWFPKAGLAGRVVDLRVLAVAGRPTHVVVRTSRTPITNLHLGGQRGRLDELRAAVGEERYAEALRTCERVAACFPRCLQVGVDLMFSPDWRRHAVAEVNAFGDLLPGLLADGRDTYAEQVHAIRSGRFAAWRAGAP